MKETTTDGADRVGADRPNLFFLSSLIRKFQESTHKNQKLTNLHLKVTFLYTDTLISVLPLFWDGTVCCLEWSPKVSETKQ